jgi:cytochrome P450
MQRLMSDPRPVLDELREKYGPCLALGAGPMRVAIIGDPIAMREVFGSPVDSFRWRHRFNVLGFVVGDDSLIVSDGADWTRRRSPLRAGFARRRLNGWVDMIVRRTDAHIDELVGARTPRGADAGAATEVASDVVDLAPFGRRLVQEIVVRSLFGDRLSGRAAEVASLFQRAQAYLESPFYRQLPHPLPLGRRARVRDDLSRLRAIVDEQIAHVRAEPSGDPLDVLEALVVDGTLTDAEIRDQVITLMGAGLDTTSASLAWMLWCCALAGHEVWARLRAEADDVLAGDGPFDQTHLARLDLADRVMRETTRLHPAGSFSPRMAHVDVGLGDHRVPKGTLILWSAHLAGREPAAWDDPLTFDPDRFVEMSPEKKALADIAWVPFGRGARNCVGFALAQMELTLIIARIAQRLDVEVTGTSMPRATGMVVNRPDGGVPARIAVRV